MGRSRCAFKAADVTRAFKGAQKAGVANPSVKIDREGNLVIQPAMWVGESENETTEKNDWDSVYEQN